MLTTAYKTLSTKQNLAHTEILAKNEVLTWMCKYSHSDCQAFAHKMLLGIDPEDEATDVKPDLESIAYCGGMRWDNSTEEKWETLYNLYTKTSAGHSILILRRRRLLTGLACTSNPEYTLRYVARLFKELGVYFFYLLHFALNLTIMVLFL